MLEGLRILCIILPNELAASLNFPIKYGAAYPASMGYKEGTKKVWFFLFPLKYREQNIYKLKVISY